MNIDPRAMPVINALSKTGGKPYIVGGFVRDMVMGIEPKDIDLEVYGLTVSDKKIFSETSLSIGISWLLRKKLGMALCKTIHITAFRVKHDIVFMAIIHALPLGQSRTPLFMIYLKFR